MSLINRLVREACDDLHKLVDGEAKARVEKLIRDNQGDCPHDEITRMEDADGELEHCWRCEDCHAVVLK